MYSIGLSARPSAKEYIFRYAKLGTLLIGTTMAFGHKCPKAIVQKSKGV